MVNWEKKGRVIVEFINHSVTRVLPSGKRTIYNGGQIAAHQRKMPN